MSHMSQHWDRWKDLWIENGWITPDGVLIERITREPTMQPAIETERNKPEPAAVVLASTSSSVLQQDGDHVVSLSNTSVGAKMTDNQKDEVNDSSSNKPGQSSRLSDSSPSKSPSSSPSNQVKGDFTNWDLPAVGVNLELKCQELVKVEDFGKRPEERRAQERVLYLKLMKDPNGPRNEKFWNERVERFLQKQDGDKKQQSNEQEKVVVEKRKKEQETEKQVNRKEESSSEAST